MEGKVAGARDGGKGEIVEERVDYSGIADFEGEEEVAMEPNEYDITQMTQVQQKEDFMLNMQAIQASQVMFNRS